MSDASDAVDLIKSSAARIQQQREAAKASAQEIADERRARQAAHTEGQQA